jgi:hypothetical protein
MMLSLGFGPASLHFYATISLPLGGFSCPTRCQRGSRCTIHTECIIHKNGPTCIRPVAPGNESNDCKLRTPRQTTIRAPAAQKYHQGLPFFRLSLSLSHQYLYSTLISNQEKQLASIRSVAVSVCVDGRHGNERRNPRNRKNGNQQSSFLPRFC